MSLPYRWRNIRRARLKKKRFRTNFMRRLKQAYLPVFTRMRNEPSILLSKLGY